MNGSTILIYRHVFSGTMINNESNHCEADIECDHAAKGCTFMIEMEFYELRLDETGADQIVILKEKNGVRMMPILIGYYEAQSIHLSLNDIKIQRPLTHDLTVRIIDALDAKMERVVVNDLRDSTFYARIHFSTAQGPVDVDSRPSDALALAVRTDTPIFVEREVLEQVARE